MRGKNGLLPRLFVLASSRCDDLLPGFFEQRRSGPKTPLSRLRTLTDLPVLAKVDCGSRGAGLAPLTPRLLGFVIALLWKMKSLAKVEYALPVFSDSTNAIKLEPHEDLGVGTVP